VPKRTLNPVSNLINTLIIIMINPCANPIIRTTLLTNSCFSTLRLPGFRSTLKAPELRRRIVCTIAEAIIVSYHAVVNGDNVALSSEDNAVRYVICTPLNVISMLFVAFHAYPSCLVIDIQKKTMSQFIKTLCFCYMYSLNIK
jgi:hypothetical protein